MARPMASENMINPIATEKTLKSWRTAVRERARSLLEELDRCPRSKRHWNESLPAFIRSDCVRHIEIHLAAIDGLTSQAIDRHVNGDARHG